MFTGIITHIGQITELNKSPQQDLVVEIAITETNLKRNLDIGCSIACNGICLTLIEKNLAAKQILLKFQASAETQNKTNILKWKINDLVNIEFSLRAGDELGGHMVLGHVDDVSKIINISQSDESWIFQFSIPSAVKNHISKKGSITINGTSLTVNNVTESYFDVTIIPHTFDHTNFSQSKIGDMVNIEIDMIARYLEKLIKK